ncbi:MAG TPA: flagellar hook-basal body complex protein FliE [Candidatus Baltobacteraceae bacterium]|nr:flagellar hook-basal body complex protein FliE [Candidatus Baltobacteraceae bacterium]
MRVEPLIPDAASSPVQSHANAAGFSQALDALGALFGRADNAENAFADGKGDLQTAVYERARADVALSVAAAAAQRAAGALQTLLNMQI